MDVFWEAPSGGNNDAECSWLAGRFGDVYPHETVINHTHRGLSHRFPRSTPGETRIRFKNRMKRAEDYMNSSESRARDGGGLAALSASLHERCARVSALKGERVRTRDVQRLVYLITSETVQSVRQSR